MSRNPLRGPGRGLAPVRGTGGAERGRKGRKGPCSQGKRPFRNGEGSGNGLEEGLGPKGPLRPEGHGCGRNKYVHFQHVAFRPPMPIPEGITT